MTTMMLRAEGDSKYGVEREDAGWHRKPCIYIVRPGSADDQT